MSESSTAELHKLMLSATKLKELEPQERYVFALSGHVFNELMMLQKMVLTSKPPLDAHPFIKDAAVGSAMFALRLLIGKTEEAMRALSKKSVADVLTTRILGYREGLSARWAAALGRYKALPWLGAIRNQRAFHYMTAGQWEPQFVDELFGEAYVIVGETYGNTLFQWQEICAGLPMLKLVNEHEPFVGLEIVLEEMGALLNDLTDCLANGLQSYMHEVLVDEDALGPVEVIAATPVEQVFVHYFHAKD